MDPRPIGIFDSGFGGLTVMKELIRHLPQEHFIYLGDTAHLPYGNKSPEAVLRYTLACAPFFLQKNIKLLVVACHTASCYALEDLKSAMGIPVIGMIDGASEMLGKTPSLQQIAVLATTGTIQSGLYQAAIRARQPAVRVHAVPCPLFVPIVEEGFCNTPLASLAAEHYLAHLQKEAIDAALLACTHYPLLQSAIQQTLGPAVRLIDPANGCAVALRRLLTERGLCGNRFHTEFFTTDAQEKFRLLGSTFLGSPIDKVEKKEESMKESLSSPRS